MRKEARTRLVPSRDACPSNGAVLYLWMRAFPRSRNRDGRSNDRTLASEIWSVPSRGDK